MVSIKWSPVALAVALAAAPAAAEVLITEYVEGSSNNKALEISNLGTTDVNLSGWTVSIASNGKTTFNSPINLSGNLPAGDSYVIANSSAADGIKSDADQTTGSLSFNGNDVVALKNGDTLVDSLGQLGNSSNFAKDATLRRKDGTSGRTDIGSAFDASTSWLTLGNDTFDGLGCAGEAACDGNGGGGNTFTCEGQTLTPIYAIQGDGASSPLVPAGSFESDDAYVTKGVVTAVTSGLFKGFWLQDANGDGNPATSDGILVYTGNQSISGLEAGQEVCVSGKVKEFFGLTEIALDAGKVEIGQNVGAPAATDIDVADGETLADAMERYEGMHVRLAQDSNLVVTRNFGFDYDAFRNNMVLSYGEPNFKPTQLYVAEAPETAALAEANRTNQLFIETDAKAPNGIIPYFPGLDAEQGYIRVGDQLVNLEGVVGYSFGDYRLVTTNQIVAGDFTHNNDRTDAPADVDGSNLRVASFNVLNFFTSASAIGGDLNITCADQADADASRGCNRGTKNAAEFELQRTKIVNAMVAIDADIFGLMEIENNGFGDNSAIANLVTELNANLTDTADHYSYITPAESDRSEGKYYGTDAIMVAILYRPARVMPNGNAVPVRMPEQHISGTNPDGDVRQLDKFQRDSLIQQFKVGKQKLTIAVNHFKSKGSGCYEDWIAGEFDDDPADLQGRCNEFRVSAAETLGKALEGVKGDVLLLGDFNAYGKEDPVRMLTDYDPATSTRKIVTAAGTSIAGTPLDEAPREVGKGFGYTNLAPAFIGEDAFSYTFDGELGSLDHAMGNKSLVKKVKGVEDWHINASESTLFEYSGRFTGDLVKSDNPYSSSDHDPVVVSLAYKEKPIKFKMTVKNRSFFLLCHCSTVTGMLAAPGSSGTVPATTTRRALCSTNWVKSRVMT